MASESYVLRNGLYVLGKRTQSPSYQLEWVTMNPDAPRLSLRVTGDQTLDECFDQVLQQYRQDPTHWNVTRCTLPFVEHDRSWTVDELATRMRANGGDLSDVQTVYFDTNEVPCFDNMYPQDQAIVYHATAVYADYKQHALANTFFQPTSEDGIALSNDTGAYYVQRMSRRSVMVQRLLDTDPEQTKLVFVTAPLENMTLFKVKIRITSGYINLRNDSDIFSMGLTCPEISESRVSLTATNTDYVTMPVSRWMQRDPVPKAGIRAFHRCPLRSRQMVDGVTKKDYELAARFAEMEVLVRYNKDTKTMTMRHPLRPCWKEVTYRDFATPRFFVWMGKPQDGTLKPHEIQVTVSLEDITEEECAIFDKSIAEQRKEWEDKMETERQEAMAKHRHEEQIDQCAEALVQSIVGAETQWSAMRSAVGV